MTDTTLTEPPSMVTRLARSVVALLQGVLIAWPAWTLVLWVSSGQAGGLRGLLFAAGVLATWLCLGSAVAAVVLTVLRPAATPPTQRFDVGALKSAALALAIALAANALMRQLPMTWMPAGWGARPELHRLACTALGTVAAAALHLLRAYRRARLAAELWVLGLLALLAHSAAEGDLLHASPPHLVHLALATGAVLLVAGFGARIAPAARGAGVALGVAAMLSCGALAFGSEAVWKRGQRIVAATELAALASVTLFDFDRDGDPSLPPGRDCDDSDPRVHEGALEIVGNGIDDNCAGGDLASVAEPARRSIAPGHRRLNVVLITIDALQARMLDPGHGAKHMPNLARFASKSAHFGNHYAHASFTNDCIGSMMTGQYPMNFAESGQTLGMEPTLAELLRSAGYATASVNQASTTPNWYGYRGFSELDNDLGPRHTEHDAITSKETSDRAIAALKRLRARSTPYLFWVHYMDPHLWYMPHAGTPFDGDDDVSRYYQEVWSTDAELGRLLRYLEDEKVESDTVIAVTPDHGERIGFGHSWFVDEDVLRGFLLLRSATIPPRVLSTRTRAVDVYPTLLGLAAGITAPSEGVSLAAIWQGRETRDRDVFARSQYKGWSLRAALRGRYKWVRDLRTSEEQLFDLRDRGEPHDVSQQHPEVVRELRDAAGRAWDRSINDRVLMRRMR